MPESPEASRGKDQGRGGGDRPDLAHEVVPTAEVRAAFAPYAWCTTLFDRPGLVPVVTNYEEPEPGVPSTFLRKTLHTFDAIRAKQSFFQLPDRPDPPQPQPTTPSTSPSVSSPSLALPGELWTLYSVGAGIDGHEGISHGGFIATLLDQQMGSLVKLHSHLGTPHTAYLHLDFKGPFRTPSAVLCRAWVLEVNSRKIKMQSVLEGEGGVPIARAEALFISPYKL